MRVHVRTCVASQPGPQQTQDSCGKPGPERVEVPLPLSLVTPAHLGRAQRRAQRSSSPRGGSAGPGLQGAGGRRRWENRGAKAPSGGWSEKRSLLHGRALATDPRTDAQTVQSRRPGEVGCTLLAAGPVSRQGASSTAPRRTSSPGGHPSARRKATVAEPEPRRPGASACRAGLSSGTPLPTSLTLPAGRPTARTQGRGRCAKSAVSFAPQTLRGAAAGPSTRAGSLHLSAPGHGRHLAGCNRPFPEGSCPRERLWLEAVARWSGSPSALHRLPAFSPRM